MSTQTKSKTQTVFLDGKESIAIVCRSCGRFKNFQADQLREHGGKTVPVKCACGTTFHVFLERRDLYRRSLTGRGWYCHAKPGAIKQPMVLVNISHTGLRFDVQRVDKAEPGDLLKVEFPLEETVIHCNVLVRNMDGSHIGAEFINLEHKAREIIGFNLMV